jgi:hypothetical protein
MRCDDEVQRKRNVSKPNLSKVERSILSNLNPRVVSVLDHLHKEDRTLVFIGQGLVC